MPLPVKPIELGYVARAHGIRGALRVVTHDPESTTLATINEVTIAGQTYEIVHAQAVQGAYLLQLAGVNDRNRAEQMRGQAVLVDRALIPLDEGEMFLADLIGCVAELPDGTRYGMIAAIQPGPQDLLVIHDAAVERLLPLVPAFVLSVDLEAGRVVVDPPEDLPETAL